MPYTKIPELPDKTWAEIVTLLRFYFEPEDLEWDAYRKIFGVTQSLRLVDLNELCDSFVPPATPPTVDDYVSGAYKEMLWQYALAALWCQSCE